MKTVLFFAFVSVAQAQSSWLNFPVPGTPRTPDGKVNLAAATPKMTDGKPDVSGVWSVPADYFKNLATDLKDDVPMLPAAKAAMKQHEIKDHADDPMALCLPPGVPRIDTSNSGDALHPFKIVQTSKLILLLYETSVNSTFRQVFLDGRQLPKDPQPTWLGYSVGRWEGSTLVVETTGFNGRAWLDTFKGHPQSDVARVTERFTRRDFGHMDLVITIDDPKSYSKPWRVTIPTILLPDTDLIETVCENPKAVAQ
jgi:hypothetical protein